MRKVIATLMYTVAAFTLAITAKPLFSTTAPFIFNVPLPERAEVLPASRVHPGTFKLDQTWDELRRSAEASPSKTIVSYGRGSYGSARVEAYVPREDSTFYYSEVILTPSWSFGFEVGRMERNGDRFTAYPTVEWGLLGISGLIVVVFGLFGWAAVPLRFRKKT